MWGTVRNSSISSVDHKQARPTSTESSSIAPLLSFDQHGDIPYPHLDDRLDSSCFWNRSRKDFCQFSLQFLFSQFGLIILVSLYIVFGGLLFYGLESRYEPHKIRQIQTKHADGIRNIRRIMTEEFNWMLNISFELRYAHWRGMLSRLDGYDETGVRV